MSKRILLVDDEPRLLKGLRFTLEQEGYETLTAMDGEEALNVFFDNQVDLILLDVMLPKMDGIQVCQRIRETSNVPIIMLTAKGEDMDKILGLEYGPDQVHPSPRQPAGDRRKPQGHPGPRHGSERDQPQRDPGREGRAPDSQGIRPAAAVHHQPRQGFQP